VVFCGSLGAGRGHRKLNRSSVDFVVAGLLVPMEFELLTELFCCVCVRAPLDPHLELPHSERKEKNGGSIREERRAHFFGSLTIPNHNVQAVGLLH
jgi:hypothetical protein